MYSFEGNFRRAPVQSLRGASKKDDKELLIKRAQTERQKREDQRRRADSTVCIQSYYRGYSVRKKCAERLRIEFDKESNLKKNSTDANFLLKLTSKLGYFCDVKKDGQRLIWLCQNIMKSKENIIAGVYSQKPQRSFLINRLLVLCLRYLVSIADTSQPIAVPMRMLETFTSRALYKNHSYLSVIWSHLIEKGYFEYMRTIFEAKVPSNLEKSTVPPTPQAGSIFSLIMSPIVFATEAKNKVFSQFILKSLCKSFFCPAFSEQIEQFLLPAMAYNKFPFPLVELIQALLQQTSDTSKVKGQKSDDMADIPKTQWLLTAVVTFAERYLDTMSTPDVLNLLLVLKQLLPCVAVHSKFGSHEDSDSEEEEMETDSNINFKSQHEDIVAFLNSQKFVHAVVRCLSQNRKLDEQDVSCVCVICYSLMSQFNLSIHKQRLLYSLAFNREFMVKLWYTCVSMSIVSVTRTETTLLQTLSRGLQMSEEDINRIVPMLSVFCSMFSHSLYTLHDADFYGETFNDKTNSMPFSLDELVPMILMLRDSCLGIIELAHPDAKPMITDDYKEALRITGVRDVTKQSRDEETRRWAYLFKVIATLVRQIYIRDARRSFCPRQMWLSDRVHIQADKPSQIYRAQGSVFTRRPFGTMRSLTKVKIDDDGPPLSNTDVKNLVILTELPFVVSFAERVKILQKLIQNDREENQGDRHHFLSGPAISVMIRRNYIYEDAFDKLSPENEPNLKLKMRVQLVNAAGLDEAGIDGGGIFREFLSELLKTGFDPNRGLFLSTTDRLLYPNPQAALLMDNFTQHYFFLGRMLGKAIYENMLVEIPFASFFLSKILSRHGGDLDIHHLASLDPEMYKNLLSLKTYDGDVADLGLDFSVVNNDFGQTKIEELKPGGRDIAVNNNNKIEYIHLMADYKINKQIRQHCTAFRQGMADLINLEWLRMFDHQELQVLISGALVPVDIADLKHHTNYSGGYTSDHRIIKWFWEAVESFTDHQKRQLLKFVTSCSRPPLLGFKDLYPAFCVHHGGSEERLPTASTCMNLLKLPEFGNEETLKNKLLYAIESGAGFELS
ncbi:ubiquitin-protein ligase E3C-like [Mytilus galloprovincialis]|uniref:ubiquitin-protein ligase E3C-like n=1 Tax=Mytilus galloprovincialis TaxID=29158 RepID=UPI003F7BA0FD